MGEGRGNIWGIGGRRKEELKTVNIYERVRGTDFLPMSCKNDYLFSFTSNNLCNDPPISLLGHQFKANLIIAPATDQKLTQLYCIKCFI